MCRENQAVIQNSAGSLIYKENKNEEKISKNYKNLKK